MNIVGTAAAALLANYQPAPPPPPVDPLTVSVETGDADRFAALWTSTNGRSTADQLQREYLDQGGRGVEVFTPSRIRDAATLFAAITRESDVYARALHACLPIVKETTGELRATYLALHALFPDRPLPQIYLVVGADISGGTASEGAQVLGLERLCKMSANADQFRVILRGFFAHETIHTFQQDGDVKNNGGVLLGSGLAEGAADFVATLATGRQIDPERAAWAAPREAELWRAFTKDLAITRHAGRDEVRRGTPIGTSMHRWIANYGSLPTDWMGQRIWQRWYDRQPDKHAALRDMLEMKDPEAILAVGSLADPVQILKAKGARWMVDYSG